MRTKPNVDAAAAVPSEERRRREGRSLKQVADEPPREGPHSGPRTPAAGKYRTQTHALHMRPGYDATRLNRLVDELETDAYRERENDRRT